jgi:kinesin family member 5
MITTTGSISCALNTYPAVNRLRGGSSKSLQNTNIRVVCRFRPENKREIQEGSTIAFQFPEDRTSVISQSADSAPFQFDRVFEANASQTDVFVDSAKNIVDDIMKGYNGTIFAYGQTGSGKTHTMMGDMESESMRGLTPRLVEEIFVLKSQIGNNLKVYFHH